MKGKKERLFIREWVRETNEKETKADAPKRETRRKTAL